MINVEEELIRLDGRIDEVATQCMECCGESIDPLRLLITIIISLVIGMFIAKLIQS